MNKLGLGPVAGRKSFGWPVLVVVYDGPKVGQWTCNSMLSEGLALSINEPLAAPAKNPADRRPVQS